MRQFTRDDGVWVSKGHRYVYPGKGRYRLVGDPPVLSRVTRLTPKGDREAFMHALERIQRIPGGGCS